MSLPGPARGLVLREQHHRRASAPRRRNREPAHDRTSGPAEPTLDLAIEQARIGWDEGGVPIGAALVHRGEVLAVGRNRRVQLGSAIRHGETDCIEQAGRLPAAVYRASVLYTTLSPCFMCAGTSLLYEIPRIVIGREPQLPGRRRSGCAPTGVELDVVDDAECTTLMEHA